MNSNLATILAVVMTICSCSGIVSAQSSGKGNGNKGKSGSLQSRALARGMVRIVANGGAQLLNKEMMADQKEALPKALFRWLKTHQHTVLDAGESPFAKRAKWGDATTSGNHLYLHVGSWPKDNKLLIPRLHNSIVTAKLVGGDEVKVKPNVADWELTLGEKPKRNILPVIDLELNEPAKQGLSDPPVVKAKDNAIELHSRYAIVHGEMLRFEPQPHKNTVGYWVNEKDWAEWQCEPTKAGRYQVELRYGCGNGQGGSDIHISIGEQKLPFQVAATGGFQAWRDVKLGEVALKAGTGYRVTAKVQKKAKNAVMDIQQITLRLVE